MVVLGMASKGLTRKIFTCNRTRLGAAAVCDASHFESQWGRRPKKAELQRWALNRVVAVMISYGIGMAKD